MCGIVGIASAGALMALSITSRRLPLLGIGGIAAFVYLTSSVVRYFGDTRGVPTALAIVIVTMLGQGLFNAMMAIAIVATVVIGLTLERVVVRPLLSAPRPSAPPDSRPC